MLFKIPNLAHYNPKLKRWTLSTKPLNLKPINILSNVFTLGAWDAISSSLCFWNPESRKSFPFKHIHAPQSNVFTHGASDAISSSLCIWNPESTQWPWFKHIHAPQSNVFTHGDSDAISFSLWIWNPQSWTFLHLSIFMLLGQYVHLYLSIFMLLRAMCSHIVLLTQFYPHCEFETSNLENYLDLSIFMFLRALFIYSASGAI